MAKHRGDMRDVVMMGPEPAVALILEPGDLPLIERLLMDYSRKPYMGGKHAHTMRGHSMRYHDARALALKIRRVRRG